jgi:hypothetical protein
MSTDTYLIALLTSNSNKQIIRRRADDISAFFFRSGSETLARDEKIRFENITKISTRISDLQFLDVPKGDGMRLHNLRLEEEYLLFEVFTGLMGYLQVNDFPAGKLAEGLVSFVFAA